ncbi:hypothetical protein [Micromonospora cathayae]|uniref:Ig-like domain-containing protein n=1 Tax=Micromonospora cathayae TaxID=3028804 RepID=A0ABY7ZTS4_9ACTN|nr:hypothetical protein [Micromonospora sp. HUAS 3]WDZ85796.1 hypothetical protein PVK37_04980 [Micromonospora sp. HUAS 3]
MAQDTLLVRLRNGSGESVTGRIVRPNGTVACYLGPYLRECQLGEAATYTVRVSLYSGSGEGGYTFSVESRRAPSECATLPESIFSFASTGEAGTLPLGLAARCFTIDQPTDTVLHVADPGGPGDVRGSVRDAQDQSVCPVGDGGECTLTGAGPYRLFLEELYGDESAYTLRMPRLSNAFGCPALPLSAFGDPGTAVGTGTAPPNRGISCQAVTSTAPGAVVVRFNHFADQYLNWTLYGDDGRPVCAEYESQRSCALPAAGNYTLLAQNWEWQPMAYQVAVTSIDRPDGCAAATGLGWDQPTLLVHQTSPVQTNCQPFQGEAGDRVMVYRAPDVYNQLAAWIVDQHGTVLCTGPTEGDGCVLPSTGGFRVLSHLSYWETDTTDLTYRMQVRSLTDPTGCPTVTPGTYNSPPAGTPGGVRCRALDLPTAGTYRVKAVGTDHYRRYASVYDSTGQRLCLDVRCEVPAAGRYLLVIDGSGADTVVDGDVQYTLAVLPWLPAGCQPVSDTGWTDPPVQGGFTADAEYDCLQLATPTGSRIVELLPGDATGAGSPEVVIVDAAGDHLCDTSWGLRQYHCELTGQGPYFAILNTRDGVAPGPYSLAFARTDGPPACPVLPAGTTGATVTTGADRFAVCFSVPADQRAARESFTWKRTSGTGDARMSVSDAAGGRYCGPTGYFVERTVSCTLPAGPVTVLLETDSVNATYQLTHRDASLPAS